VTLVLLQHVGEAAYFRQLQRIIGDLEAAGAVVQYERLGTPSAGEMGAATDEERAALATLDAREDALDEVRAFLGWQHQRDGLVYHPTWRNVDLTALQLVQMIGPAEIIMKSVQDKVTHPADDREIQRNATIVMLILRLQARDRFGVLLRLMYRATDDADASRIILDYRSRFAVEGLPADKDAALIWGSEHLDTLAKYLRQQGFRRKGRATWVSFAALPSIWSALRKLHAIQHDTKPHGN